MKLLVLGTLLLFVSNCFGYLESDYDYDENAALNCNSTTCTLPDCRCVTTQIPGGLEPEETPQFVILSFDGAIQPANFRYFEEALPGRVNPNGCPISATFFVNHEYTNYSMVHELHDAGHEIGLHSITDNPLIDYWKNASVETLTREFADQRLIMTKFAGIPAADLNGIRMPMLQMAGNNQMEMMTRSNILYDLSRGSRQYTRPGIWPYTYEYAYDECLIEPCATDSFPNIWGISMTEWNNDSDNGTCLTIDACRNYNNDANGTFEWMKKEFMKQYEDNRSPVGLYLQPIWFALNPQRFVGYMMFLDFLATLEDVYIVSASQVINWVRNPLNVTDMLDQPCPSINPTLCRVRECRLFNSEGEERYMTMCGTDCPTNYPWLGNPLGN